MLSASRGWLTSRNLHAAPVSPLKIKQRRVAALGHDVDTYGTLMGQIGQLRWLGLFGQVSRFYKWMTAGFMPQPGLVGAG
jgi:hypothetical protein